jgi:uncharacterized membrane protein YccF (DUF307 family)
LVVYGWRTGWILAAIVMTITIIGLPWTRAAFNLVAYGK